MKMEDIKKLMGTKKTPSHLRLPVK